MSSVLIVGTGFIGMRVARRLLAAGATVFTTTRSSERAVRLESQGFRAMVADVTAPESLEPWPAVDSVVLAVGHDKGSGRTAREVHLDGLRNVLPRLNEQTRRVVYASSTGVYGSNTGEWVDELTPAVPVTDSGEVCLEAERILAEWADRTDRNAVILRLAGLYGPERIIGRLALEQAQAISGDPDGWLNLIHGDDAARAVEAALSHQSPSMLYNVVDDRPITRRNYYETSALCLKVAKPTFGPSYERSPGKRVSNALMKRELLSKLDHADISVGLPACVQSDESG